uniref:Uncharacterized protein n=1 Tax=Anguilla anguilla TaxID=7936 RepID=A0A0E9PFQ0_ANGAN
MQYIRALTWNVAF